MIPNIAANGSSFRGAGAYYLHDKAADPGMAREAKPTTAERVGRVETRNLANDDIKAALDEMWRTADDAAHLKAAAGHKAGRPLAKPVKTVSLAWHPDERPTTEEKFAAADAFLAHMGWSAHQAILIEHTDTKHPHIHLIVNRVHPESGLTLDDGLERRRSQAWAHAYEKERGHIWCVERAEKLERDPTRQAEGVPHEAIAGAREAQATYEAANARLAEHDRRSERAVLSERHKAERDAFFADNKAYVRAIRDEVYHQVAEEWRETWREHHAFAKQARGEAFAFANHEQLVARTAVREGNLPLAHAALGASDAYLALAEDVIRRERAVLRAEQKADTKERQNEAAAAFIADRHAAYDALKARQMDERHELKGLQEDREAGRPHDADRLAALLAPYAPAAEPDPETTKRVAVILDRMRERHAGDKEPAAMSEDQDRDRDEADEQRAREERAKDEMRERKEASEHRDADREIKQSTRKASAKTIETLQELDAVARATTGDGPEQQQNAQERLAGIARERQRQAEEEAKRQREAEEEAKRKRETDEIKRQQAADDREAKERAAAAYFRNPHARAAEAFNTHYDPNNLGPSLARAVGAEQNMFMAEQDALDRKIAAATDRETRQLLRLEKEVNGYNYAAHLYQRSGQLAEIITGRSAGTAQEKDERRERGDAQLDEAGREKLAREDRAHWAHQERRDSLYPEGAGISSNPAREAYDAAARFQQRAAEVREQYNALREERERRQMEAERAGRATGERQRAYSMDTQAGRTETERTQADRSTSQSADATAWRERMERRREAADFRAASSSGKETRERDGPERPAREGGRPGRDAGRGDDGGRER
jgi:hypothetical protein